MVGVVVRGLRSGIFEIIIAKTWGRGTAVSGPGGMAIFMRVVAVGLCVFSAVELVSAGLALGVLILVSRIEVVIFEVHSAWCWGIGAWVLIGSGGALVAVVVAIARHVDWILAVQNVGRGGVRVAEVARGCLVAVGARGSVLGVWRRWSVGLAGIR